MNALWQRAELSVMAGFLGILLAFLGYAGWTVYADYRHVQAAAESKLSIGALALEEHTAHALGEVHWLLRSLPIGCPAKDLPAAEEERELQRRLAEAAGSLPQVSAILLADRQGRVFAESGTPASDHRSVTKREYFRVHSQDPSLSPHLGAPYSSRQTGTTVIPLSLPLKTPQGAFCGVLSAALDPGYFAAFYRQFIGDDDALVTLRREDGRFLVREPAGPEPAESWPTDWAPDMMLPGRVLHIVSRIDHKERLVAYRRLPNFPVMVRYGVTEASITGQWRRQARLMLLFGLAFCGVVLAAGRRLYLLSRAAARRERRLDLALRGGAVGLWDWDIRSGTVHLDRRSPALPGGAAEGGTDGPAHWEELVHPDDLPELRRRLDAHLSGNGESDTAFTAEYRMRDAGGRWADVLSRAQVIEQTAQGWPTHIAGSYLDITARKSAERALRRSEERYRTVVAVLSEGIILRAADGRLLTCNAMAEQILGLDAESLAQCPLDDPRWRSLRADGSPLPPAEHPLRRTLDSGASQVAEVIGLHRPDGRLVWIELATAAFWPEREEPEREESGREEAPAVRPGMAILASFADITRRKLAEDELTRSNAELEQFAYAVSHDLRQPLRIVTSYAQLLTRHLGERVDEEGRGYLQFVGDGARRMDQMLVDILEYSRIGRRGAPRAWIDSRGVAEESLLCLALEIRALGARIGLEGDWPQIFANADELERVFRNLVGNALKYRAPGRIPQITLSARPAGPGREAGGVWEFTVADNGIGIPPEYAGRLFQMFQRLHKSSEVEGTGVGLALCRRIVERHGGRIRLESPGEGQGSRFIFTLPGEAGGGGEASPAETEEAAGR